MRDLEELIGCTYKNGSHVKICRDRMKLITFLKPNPDIEEDGITHSKDMWVVKISEYQIL